MRNANHVGRPDIITSPGRYLTRGGLIVNITEIFKWYGIGYYPDNIKDTWDKSGRIYPSMLSDNDIIQRL